MRLTKRRNTAEKKTKQTSNYKNTRELLQYSDINPNCLDNFYLLSFECENSIEQKTSNASTLASPGNQDHIHTRSLGSSSDSLNIYWFVEFFNNVTVHTYAIISMCILCMDLRQCAALSRRKETYKDVNRKILIINTHSVILRRSFPVSKAISLSIRYCVILVKKKLCKSRHNNI